MKKANKSIILIIILSFFIRTQCQSVQKTVFTFDTQFSTQGVVYGYKWTQLLSSTDNNILRQTFFDQSAQNNQTQFEQKLVGYLLKKVGLSKNQTCAILSQTFGNYFFAYILNPTTKTINLFNNFSYLGLESSHQYGTIFSISQNCKALKINNTLYHFDKISQKYIKANLSFNLTNDVILDSQLSVLLNNYQEIYIYNNQKMVYQLERTESSKFLTPNNYTKIEIFRSLTHPERILITSNKFNTTSYLYDFKNIIYEIQNKQLIKIQQSIGSSIYTPAKLFYDQSLSSFVFITLVMKFNVLPFVEVAKINYNQNTMTIMNTDAYGEFSNFNTLPFIYLTQNYAYVRQNNINQSPNINLKQFVFQFLNQSFGLVSKRQVLKLNAQLWKYVIIKQFNNHISLFYLKIQNLTYQISEIEINKTQHEQIKQSKDIPIAFQFSYPVGAQLIRSFIYPKWIYYEFDEKSQTTISTRYQYFKGYPNNSIKIQSSSKGKWRILGGAQNTLNCAIALEQTNNIAKIFYYNQTLRSGQLKADISNILKSHGMTPASFRASNNCDFFSINSSLYHFKDNQYKRVSSYNSSNHNLDQSFKIAVLDGIVYQYSQASNKYQVAYIPEQSSPILPIVQIFLHQNKLIILSISLILQNKNNQYRVHYLWFNQSKWMLIDVNLQGYVKYMPNIGISPSFQSFGIVGLRDDNSPLMEGRVVLFNDTQSFGKIMVKKVQIPAQMMNFNEIPFVKLSDNYLYYRRLGSFSNQELIYKQNKRNGTLNLIQRRNLTDPQQLVWSNTFIQEVNGSLIVLIQNQSRNNVQLVQYVIKNPQQESSTTIFASSYADSMNTTKSQQQKKKSLRIGLK